MKSLLLAVALSALPAEAAKPADAEMQRLVESIRLGQDTYPSLAAVRAAGIALEPYGAHAQEAIKPLILWIRWFGATTDPKNPDLQQIAQSLNAIDPGYDRALGFLFQYYDRQTPEGKAQTLNTLRFLPLANEKGLPYFEREKANPHHQIKEAVAKGMTRFGGENPALKGPLAERLASGSTYIRDLAFPEFRALPEPEQDRVLAQVEEIQKTAQSARSWETYKVLARLGSGRRAEALIRELKPGLLFATYCPGCGPQGTGTLRRIEYVSKIPQHVQHAEQLGLYTLAIKGPLLFDNQPLDRTKRGFLDGSARCARPNTPDGPSNPFRIDEWQHIFAQREPGGPLHWLGERFFAPAPEGLPMTAALSDGDLRKIAGCEELQKAGFPTPQQVLDSIERAGGAKAYNEPHRSTELFLGFAEIKEGGSVRVFVNSLDLTDAGKATLLKTCKSKGSFHVKGAGIEGPAACESIDEEGNGNFSGLAMRLRPEGKPPKELYALLLSLKPLPAQNWRRRPATPEERRTAESLARKHLGRLGELEPPAYSGLRVVEGAKGEALMIVPVMEVESEFVESVYLVLKKAGDGWKELFATMDQGFEPFADLDADGFPEFIGTTGYKSFAVWRFLPGFGVMAYANSGV